MKQFFSTLRIFGFGLLVLMIAVGCRNTMVDVNDDDGDGSEQAPPPETDEWVNMLANPINDYNGLELQYWNLNCESSEPVVTFDERGVVINVPDGGENLWGASLSYGFTGHELSFLEGAYYELCFSASIDMEVPTYLQISEIESGEYRTLLSKSPPMTSIADTYTYAFQASETATGHLSFYFGGTDDQTFHLSNVHLRRIETPVSDPTVNMVFDGGTFDNHGRFWCTNQWSNMYPDYLETYFDSRAVIVSGTGSRSDESSLFYGEKRFEAEYMQGFSTAPLALDSGKTYGISFDTWSNSSYLLAAQLYHHFENNIYDYLALDTTPTTHEYTVVVGQEDTEAALGMFFTVYDGYNAHIYLDNVIVREIEAFTAPDLEVGNGSVTVSWPPVSDADSYRIHYGTSSDFSSATEFDVHLPSIWVTEGPTVDTVVDGLDNGTNYYFWLVAENAAGTETVFGPSATIAPSGEVPPRAPEQPSVTAGDELVKLSWPAVDDADEYHVYYGTTPTSSYSEWGLGFTDTSTIITSLSNDDDYYFWVSAENEYGESALSPIVTAVPYEGGPGIPDTPDPLTLVPGDGQVEVSWPAVDGADHYCLYYEFGSTSGQWGSNIYDTSTTVTGLENGTECEFWLVAENEYGRSEDAYGTATPTADVTIPDAPSQPVPVAGDGLVSLTWSAVSGATSYHVYYGTSSSSTGASEWGSGTSSTSATVTGLNNDTPYYFWISAENSAGEGDWSSSASATPASSGSGGPTDTEILTAWLGILSAVNTKQLDYISTTPGATFPIVLYGDVSGSVTFDRIQSTDPIYTEMIMDFDNYCDDEYIADTGSGDEIVVYTDTVTATTSGEVDIYDSDGLVGTIVYVGNSATVVH